MNMENESKPLPAVFSHMVRLPNGEQVTLEEWCKRCGDPSDFYTVRKAGKQWAVMLVTPLAPKSLKTALYYFDDRDAAASKARETAVRMGRPFKMRGAA